MKSCSMGNICGIILIKRGNLFFFFGNIFHVRNSVQVVELRKLENTRFKCKNKPNFFDEILKITKNNLIKIHIIIPLLNKC